MAARNPAGNHRPMRVVWTVTLASALMAGCSVPAAAPSSSARVVGGNDGHATSIVPAPSASLVPQGTAPPELAGRWRRSYEGAPLFLTLDGNGYSVQAAGGVGAGRIFVDGDLITFSNSNRCEGGGTYRWDFVDERLRFTPVNDDPCGRADFLPRATFGRVEP